MNAPGRGDRLTHILANSKGLGGEAMRVAMFMLARADSRGRSFWSVQSIADELGVSKSTVNRALTHLTKRGLVATISKSSGATGRACLREIAPGARPSEFSEPRRPHGREVSGSAIPLDESRAHAPDATNGCSDAPDLKPIGCSGAPDTENIGCSHAPVDGCADAPDRSDIGCADAPDPTVIGCVAASLSGAPAHPELHKEDKPPSGTTGTYSEGRAGQAARSEGRSSAPRPRAPTGSPKREPDRLAEPERNQMGPPSPPPPVSPNEPSDAAVSAAVAALREWGLGCPDFVAFGRVRTFLRDGGTEKQLRAIRKQLLSERCSIGRVFDVLKDPPLWRSILLDARKKTKPVERTNLEQPIPLDYAKSVKPKRAEVHREPLAVAAGGEL